MCYEVNMKKSIMNIIRDLKSSVWNAQNASYGNPLTCYLA